MNNTEISKMKLGEKITTLSNSLGVFADVDTAKKAVLKGLAKFDLMILQDEQSYTVEESFVVVDAKYKIINANNTEEYLTVSSIANANTIVEAQTRAYIEMLLTTFVVIVDNSNVDIKTVDTVEEAVAKVEEVKKNKFVYSKHNHNSKKTYSNNSKFKDEAYGKLYVDMDSKFAQMICSDIGSYLIASNGAKVNPNRLKSLFGKLKDLGWNKVEFMTIVCKIMDITYDYEMSTEQFNVISEYLEHNLEKK